MKEIESVSGHHIYSFGRQGLRISPHQFFSFGIYWREWCTWTSVDDLKENIRQENAVVPVLYDGPQFHKDCSILSQSLVYIIGSLGCLARGLPCTNWTPNAFVRTALSLPLSLIEVAVGVRESSFVLKSLLECRINNHFPVICFKSRGSSVGIATGYGLDDRGSRVWFPAGAGSVSPHRRVQNGSGTHSASYPMGTGGSFPGGKADGAWSWPLTSI
jgi:hypothetical protein